MADVIERLRGLVEKGAKFLVDLGGVHDFGCPEDDTCTCEYGTNQKALDKCVQALPALLAVAEAAKRVDADLCFTAPEGAAGKMDHWHDDLSTALANLEKHNG